MIFDAFTFFHELDLLQLRFEILDSYVDKFILVESRQTFSGKEKPLYYQDNKERFAQWNDKIIHIIAPNMELTDPNVLFERHWLCYDLIEAKLKEIGDPEDLAFCSDLDEIWNPEIIHKIGDISHILIQYNYSYWLNYLSNEAWTGTIGTKIKKIGKDFFKLNRTNKPAPLEDGGWHFSNMGGADQIIKKLEAYDHSNEVIPVLSQFEGYGVQFRMDHGYDFLGREVNYQGIPYQFIINEELWPQYLKDHKEQWSFLCK